MKLLKNRTLSGILGAAALAGCAQAASFSASTFATGAAVSGTSPDSILNADGSLWVSYQNGADSTGLSGSSTVVRYSWSGAVLNTWSIPGNVDGLRFDPAGGLVWALQNNDGNAALTTINPGTAATAKYSYGSSYTNPSGRGFDDVQFTQNGTFLSETNPVTGTDPIVLRLTAGPSSGPLQVTGILNSTFTGTNLATGKTASTTITDPDSLIAGPNGSLVLTGEADRELVFIHNPGAANQSASFLMLSGVTGSPDDSVFPTSSKGYFYIADAGGNTIYKLAANGLAAGSAYVDIGSVFGEVSLSTGVVTPIFSGVSPHGVVFVSSVPEPASIGFAAAGLLGLCVMIGRRKKRFA